VGIGLGTRCVSAPYDRLGIPFQGHQVNSVGVIFAMSSEKRGDNSDENENNGSGGGTEGGTRLLL
jgi:hypothetical protein